jgi:hypothetical protein
VLAGRLEFRFALTLEVVREVPLGVVIVDPPWRRSVWREQDTARDVSGRQSHVWKPERAETLRRLRFHRAAVDFLFDHSSGDQTNICPQRVC